MAYRQYFPYARFVKLGNVLEDSLTEDVLKSLVESLVDTGDWIAPKTWEYETIRSLRANYRVRKTIGTEYHKIRHCLYTLVEMMVSDGLIEVQEGNGWRYPKYKMTFTSLWRLKFHDLGCFHYK